MKKKKKKKKKLSLLFPVGNRQFSALSHPVPHVLVEWCCRPAGEGTWNCLLQTAGLVYASAVGYYH
eukprot:CAMPEP_0175002108 /NCGR_PEP_ID=MMETSP0005-20121125/3505_1 /TAXON_ID=420556 /ORGANISM="Ochromonas sp., Strain CCMP1393" /LENGTH=65 /DNA_ID=CAMNT_0016257067 /DNA_START=166 /DNA_END=366 /DNA_ORIENTATION=-